MKRAVRPALSLCAGTLVAGCTLLMPPAATLSQEQKRTLGPYAGFEECLELKRGQRLDYRFESEAPVSFAIRYRDGSAVVAPVDRGGSTGETGLYPVSYPRRYCLAWEAGARATTITYRIRVLEGQRP